MECDVSEGFGSGARRSGAVEEGAGILGYPLQQIPICYENLSSGIKFAPALLCKQISEMAVLRDR
jgi:hypothetical protein